LPTTYANIYTFCFEVESAHFTFPVVFQSEGRLQPAEGVPLIKAVDTSSRADYIRLQRRGPYLLVNGEDDGGHTRLYDLRTRQLVFSADLTTDAFFWPDGAPPEREVASNLPMNGGRGKAERKR
jgi:hypothetical protein